MSNGSVRPPTGRGVAPLLFAAGALLVYFLLISRWQDPVPAVSGDAHNSVRDSAPQLELSRRLASPPAEAVVSARGSRTGPNGWLLPLAAFVPPLLIGVVWGRTRVSGINEELLFGSSHQRVPEDDSDPEMSRDSVAEASADIATPADDDVVASAAAAPADPQPGHTPPALATAAAATAAERLDEVEELRAALRARDEVIRSLEEIVRDNRETWSRREANVDSQTRKISDLQAELAAATEVIEMLQGDGDGRARQRDAAPTPQVLERS